MYLKLFFAQASGFGGSNIDATAWEDKKCKGESRFPAQVSDGCHNFRTDKGLVPLNLIYFYPL